MDAEAWREIIQLFLWSHPQAQVREEGERLFEFPEARAQLQIEHGKLLLHLWSAERNWVRRVTGIASQAPERVVLLTQKFGQARAGRLELSARPRREGARARDRGRSQQLFLRALQQNFPDEEVFSLTHASDLEHSLSGLYVRGEMGRGPRRWAVMAASGSEASVVDGILTFGLIWLDHLRTRKAGTRGRVQGTARKDMSRVVEGLRVFLPPNRRGTTANRMRWLRPAVAKFELYEWDEDRTECYRVDAADWGNVETWLVPHGLAAPLGTEPQARSEWVRRLAPEAIQVVPRPTGETVLRFRGLEFARFAGNEAVFGVGAEENALREDNVSELEKLVQQLVSHRRPDAPDRAHPFYRLQAERWLESLVLADITQIDARLDPGFVYPQVPAMAGGDRGVIDILAVTRDARLAVIELKASEDIHLPLQGLDYWLRVRWHLDRGDFPRYGYFAGRELGAEPPLLYLVAPAFSFHSTTDGLLRYVSDEVPITRLGLNENWREGLQVVLRQ